MGLYSRDLPLSSNLYRTAELLGLDPEDKKSGQKIRKLLKEGKLKYGYKGCSWDSSIVIVKTSSILTYLREREEVKQKTVKAILEALKKLTKSVDQLTVKVEKLDKKLGTLQEKEPKEVWEKK